MSANSYESNFDQSVTYRIVLKYLQRVLPQLGVSTSQKMAWAIAEEIQKRQILPLLFNLSAVNDALDLRGIPSATRTSNHPDLIDQVSQRLPYLSEKSFASVEDRVLHELLDEAGIIRSDGLGRKLNLSARLKAGVDELLDWRAAASERAESVAISSGAPMTELIAINPTRILTLAEIVSGLADEAMPMVVDPVTAERVKQIMSRLVDVAADQGNLRQEIRRLYLLVTDRMGSDKKMRLRIEQGFTQIESKISLIERTAKRVNKVNVRLHAEGRQQIASLEQQIVALKQQIADLTTAVNEPRFDTAEFLLREALNSGAAEETLRKINQRADASSAPVIAEDKAYADAIAATNAMAASDRAAAARVKAANARAAADAGSYGVSQRGAATASRRPAARVREQIGCWLRRVIICSFLLAYVVVGFVPLASTSEYPVTNPIAKLQESIAWHDNEHRDLTILNYVATIYRDDGETYLKQSAISAVGKWLEAIRTAAISKPLSTELLELNSGRAHLLSRGIVDGKVSPQFRFSKDTASVKQWHKLLGLLVTEKLRNPKFNDTLGCQTAQSLTNWLRGYQPPSVREANQRP